EQSARFWTAPGLWRFGVTSEKRQGTAAVQVQDAARTECAPYPIPSDEASDKVWKRYHARLRRSATTASPTPIKPSASEEGSGTIRNSFGPNATSERRTSSMKPQARSVCPPLYNPRPTEKLPAS